MKKFNIIIIIFLTIYSNFLFAYDIIPVFLEYYECGERIETIYFELKIYNSKNWIEWESIEIDFTEDYLDKKTIISTLYESSSGIETESRIKIIKWEQGKYVKFLYYILPEPLIVEAKKKKDTKYIWEVYGKGKFRRKSGRICEMEIKSVRKQVKLKYNTLKLPALYYK